MSRESRESLAKKNSTNVRSGSIKFEALRFGFRVLGAIVPGIAAKWAAELFLTPRRHRRPDRERDLLAVAASFKIDWKGKRLAAWSWGSGPTILLVHGWEGRGTQLGDFIYPLVEAGYRVVAFDGPGHGDSEGNRSSVVDLADAIKTVAHELGYIEAIIAHSMGGAATTLAVSLGMQQVRRLIYIAPPTSPVDYIHYFARIMNLKPEVTAKMQNNIENRFNFKMSELSGPAIAPKMDKPLLVFHDREDRDVPFKYGQELVAAWPEARLIPTTGLGHKRILHDSDVLDEAIGFIKGQAQPRAFSVIRKSHLLKNCERQGCKNFIKDTWDSTGHFCSNCSIEMELYDPQSRWGRLSA